MDGMAFIRRLGEAKVAASLIVTSSLERALLDSIETMSAAYGIRLLGTIEKPASPERFAQLIAAHWQLRANPEKQRAPMSPFALDEVLAGIANDEFVPFFQPKIELRSGRVRGFEALARWRHPRRGMVLPYAFIQLLEQHDQIGELTWSMLAQAAAQCRRWREAGFDIDVSVNLSVAQLGDPAISDAVTWQVVNQGLDPRHMVLEITESVAMSNVGAVLENLARLRMKGFGLSIDDYGTGYSSMQQDRPVVRRSRDAPAREPADPRIEPGHVAQAQHHLGRRGRGNAGGLEPAARLRLRPGAGLLHRQADGSRGGAGVDTAVGIAPGRRAAPSFLFWARPD
jgi:hypothetical protein